MAGRDATRRGCDLIMSWGANFQACPSTRWKRDPASGWFNSTSLEARRHVESRGAANAIGCEFRRGDCSAMVDRRATLRARASVCCSGRGRDIRRCMATTKCHPSPTGRGPTESLAFAVDTRHSKLNPWHFLQVERRFFNANAMPMGLVRRRSNNFWRVNSIWKADFDFGGVGCVEAAQIVVVR